MSSEPDEKVKHGIVNVPLKKVRGSINDVWNHKNPDVSTAVKLTPYRPSFTEQPTERFLPETQFSPFEGIPADSCVVEVIEVGSEEEEDWETWRRREEERDRSRENSVTATATTLSTSTTTSEHNNIATNESHSIGTNNITATVPTKSDNNIATTTSTKSRNNNNNNHITTTISTKPRHTNNNIATTAPTKSRNNDEHIVVTKPRNNSNNSVATHTTRNKTTTTTTTTHTASSNHNSVCPVPTSSGKTASTGVGKPLVIRATLGCLSEVERMKKGMQKVSQLKKNQVRKELGRRRPTLYASESASENHNNPTTTTTSSNNNNNTNSSNINNNNNNNVNDNMSNSRGARRGLSHEGVDLFVPKKKTTLRKTSVSDIVLG